MVRDMEMVKMASAMLVAAGRNPEDSEYFWFNDHGKAIFRRVGDDNDDYPFMALLVRQCHKPITCLLIRGQVEFPNPGGCATWPCGCKCVASAIPDLEGVDIVVVIENVIKEAIDRMKALGG